MGLKVHLFISLVGGRPFFAKSWKNTNLFSFWFSLYSAVLYWKNFFCFLLNSDVNWVGDRVYGWMNVFDYAPTMSLRGPGLSIYNRGRRPSLRYVILKTCVVKKSITKDEVVVVKTLKSFEKQCWGVCSSILQNVYSIVFLTTLWVSYSGLFRSCLESVWVLFLTSSFFDLWKIFSLNFFINVLNYQGNGFIILFGRYQQGTIRFYRLKTEPKIGNWRYWLSHITE